MKKCNFILSIALTAILASCSKESDMPTVNESKNEVKINLAVQSGTDETTSSTRTTVEYTEGDETAVTKWQSGDKLLVYGAENPFTLNAESNNQTSGNFEGSITLGEGEQKHIYAIYEGTTYDIDDFSGSDGNLEYTFQHPTPMEQNVNVANISTKYALGKYAYLYGKSSNAVSAEQTNANIEMKAVTAMKEIKLSDLPLDKEIDYIDFVSSSNFVTQYKVNLDSGVGESAAQARDYIRTKINYLSDDISGNMTIYVPLFPQTLPIGTDIKIKIKFVDDENIIEYSYATLTEAIEYAAGGIYPTSATISYNLFEGDNSFDTVALFDDTNIPTFDEWTFLDSSVEVEDLAKVRSALLALSSEATERKITINFPNLKTLPAYSFHFDTSVNQTALESLNAPNLTTLATYAFARCRELKRVMIPLVETTGAYAFFGCSLLVSVNAENKFELDKVKTATSDLFENCSSVKEISMAALEIMNGDVFKGCSNLTKLTIATKSTKLNVQGALSTPIPDIIAKKVALTIGTSLEGVNLKNNSTIEIVRIGTNVTADATFSTTFSSINL